MPLPPGRSYRAAALLFVLAWGVLASPWLTGRVTIPYDAKAHFHAQIQFLANALHTGQSPAWSPNVFAGSPQIADPQSLIFSPAILLAALSPAPSFQLFDGYVLALLAVGGLAILALFRDRGWHPAGGVLAALVFAFGASAAWRVQHIGQVQSYAMFAVALWTLARALDRSSARWGIAAGLAAGLMVVEPDQIALLGVYLLAGTVVGHVAGGPEPWTARASRTIRPLAAGAIAGGLIVIVPLVLTVLFAASSSRSEVAFSEAARGSLHPASLLTAVIGDLFGALSQSVDYWGPYSESWNPAELTLSQNMSQIYSGILVVALIIVAGIGRGWLWAAPLRATVVMLAVVVIFALGAYTPVFRLFYEALPGVAMFRRPADATFFIGALSGIAGGYLLHRWLTDTAPMRIGVVALTTFLAIFFAAITIAFAHNHWVDARWAILEAALWLTGGLLLLWLLTHVGRSNALIATALVAAFTTADLAINNGPNESTALPPQPYDILEADTRNSTVRALKALTRQPTGSPRRDRVELAGLGFDWPNAAMVHGFDHVLGYNPLRLGVFTDAVGAGDTIAGWDQRKFTALFPSYRSLLADLLGLRFIATPVPIETIDKRLKADDFRLIGRTRDAYLYENPRALPRAMLVHEAIPADFDELIVTGAWPAFDPSRTVLLEDAALSMPSDGGETRGFRPISRNSRHGPASRSAAATLPSVVRLRLANASMSQRPPSPSSGDTVTLARYENTRIEVEVFTRNPGWLVLNDVWHPWWEATVNGQRTDVLKANVMFRAVRVHAGRSRVAFSFAPLAGAARELSARMSKGDAARRVLARRIDGE